MLKDRAQTMSGSVLSRLHLHPHPHSIKLPGIQVSRTLDKTYKNPETGREMFTAGRNYMSRIFWHLGLK